MTDETPESVVLVRSCGRTGVYRNGELLLPLTDDLTVFTAIKSLGLDVQLRDVNWPDLPLEVYSDYNRPTLPEKLAELEAHLLTRKINDLRKNIDDHDNALRRLKQELAMALSQSCVVCDDNVCADDSESSYCGTIHRKCAKRHAAGCVICCGDFEARGLIPETEE